ncbi:unnamed protein product [Rodentolepis nana]|uniref:Secreted protein n=1 Tax=Rodentolepis nana TaxID=102285 RepID=A0A0R3TSC8_RODNA|nr:unnamed protein product [Rodentolepis nana]
MKFVLLILCLWCVLSAGSFIRAPYQYPPRYPRFAGCQTDSCHEGNYTGFGCQSGRCTYICSDGLCNGYSGTQEYLFPQMQTDLTRPWAPGARNLYGCSGGNCGFWGGCSNGYCAGRYDFRGCDKSQCQYGPFRGYGCDTNRCQVICYDKRCHLENVYGYEVSEVRIETAYPRSISELKSIDLSNFFEAESDLTNIKSKFWQFYKKKPESWAKDLRDPDLWEYLYHRAGKLQLKGPQVQMPGDACDAPQCGYCS